MKWYRILTFSTIIYQMPAHKNNQHWKRRSKHGRDKLFATPELLMEAAEEYFNSVDATPAKKIEITKVGDSVTKQVITPVALPYTLEGFLTYIDAGKEYWRNFKKAGHKDFQGVIDRIENIMYNNKFSGAASGFFNANIISRDLGLRDNLGLSDGDGKPLQMAPSINITTVTAGAQIAESENEA